MNIKYLKNSEIDRVQWDECIMRALESNTYAFSWYLDTVCESWDALIADDYQAVFPIPFKKKYGLYVVYQPLFAQQLGIFSQNPLSNELQTQILQAIPPKFKIGRMQLNSMNYVDKQLFKTVENINFELPLHDDYATLYAHYSDNAKRNLKKAQKAILKVTETEEVTKVISMFQKFKLPTLKHVPITFFSNLERIFETLKQQGKVIVYEVYTAENELCASVLLMNDGRRLVYLFSGCTPMAYKNGAQFFLVDFIVRKYSNQPLILDFEGSNDVNLARFYQGFGSQKTTYPVLFFENFPKCFIKILQKMHKI